MLHQDALDRHLRTLSTMEKRSVVDLVAAPLESEWLWLLGVGSMDARVRSGILNTENLPGQPVQVVELIGKPYALLQYASSQKAAAAVNIAPTHLFLAFAAAPIIDRVLADLRNNAPPPQIDPARPSFHTFPNDLLLVYDLITAEEEQDLIEHVRADAQWSGPEKRQSLHFGPHFDYTTFAVSASAQTPPPPYLTRLLDRLPFQGERDVPDQFTIQYYPPGTGIPPHVDTHSAFEEILYSFSFGAAVPMSFRKCGAREARRMRLPKRSLGEVEVAPAEAVSRELEEKEVEEWDLVLPPRSLLVIKGASRWGYTHGIKSRRFDQEGYKIVPRQDRYSVTMRRVKPKEEVGCECPYPDVCDWRIRQERAAKGIGQ